MNGAVTLVLSLGVFFVNVYILLYMFKLVGSTSGIACRTAVLVGLLNAACFSGSVFGFGNLFRLSLQFFVSYTVGLLVVFLDEPAFAIIAAIFAVHQGALIEASDPGLWWYRALLVAGGVGVYFSDKREVSEFFDGLRDLLGFRESVAADLKRESYLTGPDTVFVQPIALAVLVAAYALAMTRFGRAQSGYMAAGDADLTRLLDPAAAGLENLARYEGQK